MMVYPTPGTNHEFSPQPPSLGVNLPIDRPPVRQWAELLPAYPRLEWSADCTVAWKAT